MKLVELNPRWFAEEGRHGQGLTFACPHCGTQQRLAVTFANPLDGGAPFPIGKMERLWNALLHSGDQPGVVPPGYLWQRVGDTFGTLTLTPSVNAEASGHWHGWIQNGDVR